MTPLLDPEELACFLDDMRRDMSPDAMAVTAVLSPAELVLIATALRTHAAEIAIKAKAATGPLEIIRTCDPANRYPPVDPITGVYMEPRAKRPGEPVGASFVRPGHPSDTQGAIPYAEAEFGEPMTEAELLAGLDALIPPAAAAPMPATAPPDQVARPAEYWDEPCRHWGPSYPVPAPLPSPSGSATPSCSLRFGIADSTPGTDSGTCSGRPEGAIRSYHTASAVLDTDRDRQAVSDVSYNDRV